MPSRAFEREVELFRKHGGGLRMADALRLGISRKGNPVEVGAASFESTQYDVVQHTRERCGGGGTRGSGNL